VSLRCPKYTRTRRGFQGLRGKKRESPGLPGIPANPLKKGHFPSNRRPHRGSGILPAASTLHLYMAPHTGLIPPSLMCRGHRPHIRVRLGSVAPQAVCLQGSSKVGSPCWEGGQHWGVCGVTPHARLIPSSFVVSRNIQYRRGSNGMTNQASFLASDVMAHGGWLHRVRPHRGCFLGPDGIYRQGVNDGPGEKG
jgi:hypothetical protein